jgi:hypothetical protein
MSEELKEFIKKATQHDNELKKSRYDIRLELETERHIRLEDEKDMYTTYAYNPHRIDLRNFQIKGVNVRRTKLVPVDKKGLVLRDKIMNHFVKEKESEVEYVDRLELKRILQNTEQKETKDEDERR